MGAPGWRSAFLRALAGCANVRAAARMAGIDHSGAYALRKRHAPFARAWQRAVRIGRARVEKGEAGDPSRPTGGPLHRDASRRGPPPPGKLGEDMVLRHSRRCGAQLVRSAEGRWSDMVEQAFLDALRATACVRRAAEAVGMSDTALYNRRMRYPAFAQRWLAVEEEGKARLHAFVVEAGLKAFDPSLGGEETPKATVGEAIAILRLKGPSTPLGTGLAGPADEGPTIEEVRDEVLRRLAAMRRHRERG